MVIVVTAVLDYIDPALLDKWAPALGLMAAILAAVQYLPQIWTTYHLKHVGSLSIPMMCIQTPGGFLFAGSLFARLGWGGWSSWGIFLLTALMQGILLCLAIYYEIRSRKDKSSIAARAVGDDDHRKPPRRSRMHLHANGFDDDTPGSYTNHPENYPEHPEQHAGILDRQESDAAAESTPLLQPGGIGDPHRNYDTNRR